MKEIDKIELQFNKSKISLYILVTIIFVVIGVLFSTHPENFNSLKIRNPNFIRIVGILAIIFFGTAVFFIFLKLFDKKSALIIDETGIIDYTNFSSIGLIKWEDIQEIKTEKVASTKFILIYVFNPEIYLNKAKGLKKLLLKGNNLQYKTPLSITFSTIKCDFNQIEKFIYETFERQRKKT